MLVLTRRAGERVRIGDEVELVVVSVRGDQVRLGFAAPRRVAIRRAELLEAVGEENRAAARTAARADDAAIARFMELPAAALKQTGKTAEDRGGAPAGSSPHRQRERRSRTTQTRST